MSDESTSVSDSIQGLGDAVDNAVAGNSQEASQTSDQSQQTTDAYGNPTGAQAKVQVKDAKATLNDPKASKSQKQQAVKTLKKLTLKIDGEEFEEELPFEIPNDPKAIEFMKRELQMGRMGQKRAQEKAAIEKDVMQFLQDLKKNPKKALSDPAIGMDLKAFAAQIIEEEIENSKKSPEQLALEQAQEEIRQMKEQRDKEKKDSDEKAQEALKERYYQDYENQMIQAFDTNKIPKSPAAIKKMADYMEIAVQAGKDVSINDLVPLIREELVNDFLEHINALPDDELENFIPKAVQDRLRKKSVAKIKKANSNPAVKGAANAPPSIGKEPEKKEEAPKKTIRELFGV